MKAKKPDNNDCWVIFGSSPFILDIQNHITHLCDSYPTIGLNLFPSAFEHVNYWLFSDSGIFHDIHKKGYIKPHHRLIVNKDRVSELKTNWFRKAQCSISNRYLKKPHCLFEGKNEISLDLITMDNDGIEKASLLCAFSVVLAGINYALLKGAKRLVLAGIDLHPDWKHFYSGKTPKAQWQIEFIKEKIDEFQKHVDIYNINPRANMNCPYLSINEL